MSRYTRATGAVLAAAVAYALGATSQAQAQAQAPAAEDIDASGLTTVTVTARRREERAQDVPLAITALGEEAMLEKNVRSVYDLEKNIPGLAVCCSKTDSNFTFLRGVKGVVGYWAEVPANLSGSGLYFDVGNVQVLKGPQGTLFGLSTNGGAILNEPVRPSRELGGFSSFVVGDYNRQTIDGVLNVPVSDTLSVRIGAQTHHIDGYTHDLSNDKYYGGEDYWIARVSALWEPTENFSNYSVLNYYKYDGTQMTSAGNAIIEAFSPTGRARTTFGSAEVDAYMQRQHELGRYTTPGTSIPGGPRTDSEQINFVDIAALQLSDDLTFRTIFGLQSVEQNSVFDTDGTPFPINGTSVPNPKVKGPTNTYTIEPQLQGNAFDDRLNYTVGSFNSWTDAPTAVAQYSVSLGVRNGAMVKNEGRTHSVYGEGNYSLTDALIATVGYRYTWDYRDSATQNVTSTGDLAGPLRLRDGQWSEGSYRIGLSWKPSDHTMLYLTDNKGYSSGGFNGGNLPASLQSYGPESLDNIELGIKSDWFPGGTELRTNVALYYGMYDDIQVFVETAFRNPDTNALQSTLATQNAGKGTVKGVEGEFTFLPVPSLELYANFAYMDAEYTRFFANDPADTTGQSRVDLRGVPFVFVPEWKYTFSATYRLPEASFGDLSTGVSYNWVDEVANTARFSNAHPYVNNPSLENLDANITWRNVIGNPGVTAAFQVNNILNEDHNNGVLTGYDTIGTMSYGVAWPRTWSLRLRYDF